MSKEMIFIGPYNSSGIPRGGDEHKNRVLFEALKDRYKLQLFDTYNWKMKPLRIFRLLIRVKLGKYDSIIISSSSVSAYRFICLLKLFQISLDNIYYFVIGGNLPKLIRESKYDISIYSELKSIFAESIDMRNRLADFGLKNVIFLPNFKKFNLNSRFSRSLSRNSFVYLGRVHESKGIVEIFMASRILQMRHIDHNVTIFGPIDDKFKPTFERLLDKTDIIDYGGILNLSDEKANESYQILADNLALLFPTYWFGEGFPGVLIDSMIAGIPTIATHWNLNEEIVEDGYNGIMIPPRNTEALAEAMIYFISNPNSSLQMGNENYKLRVSYHISEIQKTLYNVL